MRLSLHEQKYKRRGLIVAGIDEAGRGPWAGPLVSCACIIPKNTRIQGLNDSKKLSPEQREVLFNILINKCQYGLGISSNKEIDKNGLAKALKSTYKKAVHQLIKKGFNPNFLLIDGIGQYQISHNNEKLAYKTVKRGDSFVKCIAAASIIAKVTRDKMMIKYALKHKKYDFQKHKGYGTRLHKQNLLKYGVCDLHRKSFEPIKAIINGSSK